MNREIAKKIRKLRKLKNISQKELAEKAGIAQSTLSYIENGRKTPQFDTLSAICKGLGTSVFALLTYEENKTGKNKFKESGPDDSRLSGGGQALHDLEKSLYAQVKDINSC